MRLRRWAIFGCVCAYIYYGIQGAYTYVLPYVDMLTNTPIDWIVSFLVLIILTLTGVFVVWVGLWNLVKWLGGD